MPTLRPIALITGASSGIGAAFARLFAAEGHELVLVALPDPQLAAIADEIAASGRARPLTLELDLTQKDAGLRIAHAMARHGVEPAIVVNCAGFGLVGPAAALDRNAQLAMFDLNARALTDLSLRFVDSLTRHRGGILNVASVSAFLPAPEMAVYNASKTYVLSLQRGAASRACRARRARDLPVLGAGSDLVPARAPASVPGCRGCSRARRNSSRARAMTA